MNAVNVEEKLGIDKFHVHEGHAHIVLCDAPDRAELQKLVNACPAGLYRLLPDGSVQYDCVGCLECGACRILCGSTILKQWEYPQGGFGIEYRYG